MVGANKITQATPTYFFIAFVIAFWEIFFKYFSKIFKIYIFLILKNHIILLRFMLKNWQKM
jgi:hypothetical protein